MADESVEALIAKRFIARQDVKAVQSTSGAYYPACESHHRHDGTEGSCQYAKWTMNDLRDHVAGRKTYGHYLLNHENVCKFFCFDLDFDKEGQYRWDEGELVDFNPREAWRDGEHPARSDLLVAIRTLAEGLALRVKKMLDYPVIISYSGNKGMHVYGLTGPEPAAVVRALAISVLEGLPSDHEGFTRVKGEHFWKHMTPEGVPNNVTIEVFPKQDTLDAEGFGNLIRLPLGINQKSKQPGFFVDPNTPYDVLRSTDPLETLLHGSVWAS